MAQNDKLQVVCGHCGATNRLAKLDTEQAPELAAQLQIRSIPTLALFQGGREIARQSGAVDWPRWSTGSGRSLRRRPERLSPGR